MYPSFHSVAGTGGKYHNSVGTDDLFDQNMAFIVVATTIELVIAVILLIDILCAQCISRKVQAILFVILLVLEFAIIVNVSIETSKASIINEKGYRYSTDQQDKLDHFENVGIADSVISWIIKVPLLAIVTYLAIDHLDNGQLDIPGVNPPVTNERM